MRLVATRLLAQPHSGCVEHVRHWVEVIADRVVKRKQPPFVVLSGITTSGPVHLGTICEFLFPHALAEELRRRGFDTEMVFVADDLDAFDAIPFQLREYADDLTPELGKPLSSTRDPLGCHASFADHFFAEVREVATALGVEAKWLRASELYAAGRYDPYALLFLKRVDEVRSLWEEVTGRRLPAEWKNVVMPICPKCGRVATTWVTQVEGDRVGFRCRGDVVTAYGVRGCGYEGTTTIANHRFKLPFRLDWPSRQHFLNASVEGAGKDHHTKGGTWEMAVAVHRRILGSEPPVGFRFGFVLLEGRKFSKSKGIGVFAQDVLKILPPEVIRYALLVPNAEEDRNWRTDGRFYLRIINKFERAWLLAEQPPEQLSRARLKEVKAARIAGRPRWRASFTDVVVAYQAWHNWDLVANYLKDPDGVAFLKPYIEEWLQRQLLPEEYRFELQPGPRAQHPDAVRCFAERLESEMDPVTIHNLVYSVAEEVGLEPKELFADLYRVLLGKPRGPRMGRLIHALGVTRVKELLLRLYTD